MRILICDDEIKELQQLENIVKDYASKRPELTLEIRSFSNPFDVLTETSENGPPDIALLDICMPGILGTEVAREFQQQNGDGTDVIFLTTSAEFAVEAFTLHAEDYLKKPYMPQRLKESLDRVIEKRQKRLYALVQCGKETCRIDLFTVLYGEIRDSNLEIHLRSGAKLTSRMSLAKFADLFRELTGFVTVGASYLVNLRCVQNLHQTTLEMSNGDLIPIPRRLRLEVKKQYFDFYKEEAMGR